MTLIQRCYHVDEHQDVVLTYINIETTFSVCSELFAYSYSMKGFLKMLLSMAVLGYCPSNYSKKTGFRTKFNVNWWNHFFKLLFKFVEVKLGERQSYDSYLLKTFLCMVPIRCYQLVHAALVKLMSPKFRYVASKFGS